MKNIKNKMGIILCCVGAVLCVIGVALVIISITGKNTGNGNTDPAQASATESVTDTLGETETTNSTEENSRESREESSEAAESREESKPVEETGEKEENREEEKETITMAVPSKCGALSVKGSQLVDKDGNPVQLRGVSTHGLAWFPGYVNQECFKEFHDDWNANVVRLAMYTAEGGGYCTDGNKEDLKNIIYRGVQYATDADMYVIIDWHILHDNNPNTYKDEAKKFFDEMSKKYADSENILYEICNEPNGNTSWSEIKSYAEEIIPVIRNNDEDAVIIVGTPTWSQRVDEAAKDPLAFDNVMYALHFYAATHKEDIRNKMTSAIDSGLPVFISEFSICDASGNGGIDYDQAAKWMDAINQYGVSYVMWNLANKNETSSLFKSSCSKNSGFTMDDLSDTGKWLYKQLTGESEIGNSLGGNKQNNGQGNSNQNNNQNNGQNNQNNNTGNKTADGTSFTFTSSGLNGTITLKSSWEEGGKTCYQFDLSLSNPGTSSVSQWAIDIHFDGDVELKSGWSGNYSANGNTLHITNADYNGNIGAGSSISDMGFMITGKSGLTVTQ